MLKSIPGLFNNSKEFHTNIWLNKINITSEHYMLNFRALYSEYDLNLLNIFLVKHLFISNFYLFKELFVQKNLLFTIFVEYWEILAYLTDIVFWIDADKELVPMQRVWNFSWDQN